MQKVNTVPPKNTGPSAMQKLLQERKVIHAEKWAEAEGIKKSVKSVWDSHNDTFDKKISLINLDIAAENSKGIGKKIKHYQKR